MYSKPLENCGLICFSSSRREFQLSKIREDFCIIILLKTAIDRTEQFLSRSDTYSQKGVGDCAT